MNSIVSLEEDLEWLLTENELVISYDIIQDMSNGLCTRSNLERNF